MNLSNMRGKPHLHVLYMFEKKFSSNLNTFSFNLFYPIRVLDVLVKVLLMIKHLNILEYATPMATSAQPTKSVTSPQSLFSLVERMKIL